MSPLPRILFCQCSFARVLPPEVKAAVLSGLADSGRAVTVVDDLCGLAARKDPLLENLSRGGAFKIAACYPRAVRWLFAAAGLTLDPTHTQIVNLRVKNAEAALAQLLDTEPAGDDWSGPPNASAPLQAAEWFPWFPVIDFERCTHCLQCLSFCLFGVYGVDAEGRLSVPAPENCKTNCPACSRVCPEAAIMFPKYAAGPINGEAVKDTDVQREKMKVDVSALLGGDVYSRLRERSERARSRFSSERDPDKALAERQRCLAQLAGLGPIPAEVLMSLPSAEEIGRRAAAARARAAAALENRDRRQASGGKRQESGGADQKAGGGRHEAPGLGV